MFELAAGSGQTTLQGRLAVAFFARSGLPQQTLKTVWATCDRGQKGFLTRSEFVLAARLVALSQVGLRPTLEQLINYKQKFPIPKFELPDNIYTDDFDVSESERAIKHEYDTNTQKWRRTLVNVVIDRYAFAEGAMRAAYHMRDLSASGEKSQFVAKIAKVIGTPVAQYFDDVRMQTEAQKWAHEFNGKNVPKRVEFIAAYVMELIDRPNRPICGVELFVPGQYVKYNNNWDWSDDRRNTPQVTRSLTYDHCTRSHACPGRPFHTSPGRQATTSCSSVIFRWTCCLTSPLLSSSSLSPLLSYSPNLTLLYLYSLPTSSPSLPP